MTLFPYTTLFRSITNSIELIQKQKANSKNKKEQTQNIIESLRKEMKEAAKKLDFERATQIRDFILELESDE